ncbi:MAG: flippase [Mollicutes bacterium]|nr:flippase [Mollicutes bacterium]
MEEKKAPSLKINIILSFGIQLITYLVPLISAPYVARILLPDGVGSFSYAYSITTIFALLITWGFPYFGTRNISKLRDDKNALSNEFWSVFFSRALFFFGLASIFFILYFTHALGNVVDDVLLLICSLSLLNAVFDISYLYQGLEQFKWTSLATFISSLSYLICIFIFVRTKQDLWIYTLIKSLQATILNIVLFCCIKGKINKPDFKQINIWRVAKGSAPFLLPVAAIQICTLLDQAMLGNLASTSEVGFYQQATKITSLVTNLIAAIAPVILSRIAIQYKNGEKKEIKEKTSTMFELALLIALPSIGGLLTVGDSFILAYFGSDFSPAINVLYVLTPTVLFLPLASLITSLYFFPYGKEKLVSIFYFASMALNCILNYFFIKLWGAFGAGIATTISNFALVLLCIIFSTEEIDYKGICKKAIKPLISSIIMALVIFGVNLLIKDYITRATFRTLVLFLVGVIIYYIFIRLTKEELVNTFALKLRKKIFKGKNKENEDSN